MRPAHGRLFSELWYLREASTLVFAIVRDRWAQRWRIRRSESKDTWGGDMTGIGRDGANALRGLLRVPGFTLAIGITLAVAIGATTTIFSLANAASSGRSPTLTPIDW